MEKVGKKVSWEIVKRSSLSVIILFLFLAAYVFYRTRKFPTLSEQLQQDLKKYIGTIFIICLSFVIQKIVGAVLNWYTQNIAAKTETELDDKLIPLLRRTLKVIIWVIALIMILPLYGVNINALIATLGVASLAIALAAKDTIANIISGFLIMIDTPFRVGDKIKLPTGEVAEVLDIGVRRSKFLSEDKTSIIIVPNLDLSKKKIVNYTYGEERAGKEGKRSS
jgi:small-conductance mechanosensitive channel